MTSRLNRWPVLACAALLLVGSVGCTATSADPAPSTAATTASASVTGTVTSSSGAPTSASSVVTPSVASPTTDSPTVSASLSPAAREKADRAAVEAAWVKFWDVYSGIVRTPAAERSSALEPVAVNPIKAEIIAAAKRFDDEGLDYYGSVKHRPTWVTPVNGRAFAVMRDCQDQSAYGSLYVATGKKRSVGVDRDSLQAGFVRGSDEIWRVQQLQYLDNVPC